MKIYLYRSISKCIDGKDIFFEIIKKQYQL